MVRIVLVLGMTALVASVAWADTISIPLPQLVGPYQAIEDLPPGSGPVEMFTTLVLPPEVTVIDNLRLVVSGVWHAGVQWCSGVQGPEPSPFQPGLAMFLDLGGAPFQYFSASVLPPDGEFTNLADEFRSCCPPGALAFDELLGVPITVHFFVDWAILGICWVETDTYGELTDVRLEITGTVPVEPTAWGSIKSLWR